MMRTGLILLVLLPLSAALAKKPEIEALVADLGRPATMAAAYRELRKVKDPELVPLLEAALPDLNSSAQVYGVLVLEYAKTDPSLDALRRLARHPSPYLRVLAGISAARRGAEGMGFPVADALLSSGVPEATRSLMIYRARFLNDPIVSTTLGSLLRRGESQAILSMTLDSLHAQNARGHASFARILLADERPDIRSLAAAFLFRFGREDAAAAAAEGIESKTLAAADKIRLLRFLVASGRTHPAIREALKKQLAVEKSPTVLLELLSLVQATWDSLAAPAARRLLDHADRAVAAKAYTVLLDIVGGVDRETLMKLLASKRPDVRLRAADGLRRMDDSSGLSVVAQVIEAGRSAEDRLDAAGILGGYRVPEAVEPLLTGLLDQDRRVRLRSMSSLLEALRFLLPYRRISFARAGYDADRGPEENRAAVEGMRTWWNEARARDW